MLSIGGCDRGCPARTKTVDLRRVVRPPQRLHNQITVRTTERSDLCNTLWPSFRLPCLLGLAWFRVSHRNEQRSQNAKIVTHTAFHFCAMHAARAQPACCQPWKNRSSSRAATPLANRCLRCVCVCVSMVPHTSCSNLYAQIACPDLVCLAVHDPSCPPVCVLWLL